MKKTPKTNNLSKEYPYMDSLPKEAKKWMNVFHRADTFGSPEWYEKLGQTPERAKELANEAYTRNNARYRDIYSRRQRENFYEEGEDFNNVLAEAHETVTVPYEDIIDTKREITKRTLHEGYGHAPNIKEGSRVALAIEGHALQGRLGTVIRKRQNEWLIQFDHGAQGYYSAREVFEIQQHQQVG